MGGNVTSPSLDPGASARWFGLDRPALPATPSQAYLPTPLTADPYRPDVSYHPQVQPPTNAPGGSPQCAGGPFALPPGQTLAQAAGGKQAQPFDVTLSQLATAVYGTRGDPPPGWSAVSDQDLRDHGVSDPTTWRQTFLGGGEQTTQQEFKAEVYRDCDGNFVLSYRGTAEGAADWENNFKQGTGFQTDPVDKFSGTAVNTAVEFQRVFGTPGADGKPTNLAITGHSQGGGLATVGSLATGVPAVTFDASGIHPNTLDRMKFADPQQARDIAEGGQIRAYSLKSDALTQLQEGSPLGLLAPDALGTKIVVAPGPLAQHTLAGTVSGIEWGLPAPVQGLVNGLVEGARYSPVPLVNGVGDLAYSALSHNPNVLTAAMIEKAPWQPGYENPSDFGKSLQDLVPDPLKDDFARNTNDLITDVVDVANTDFAKGDYVQGGFSLFGDVSEGAWNTAGDTAHRTADVAADAVDQHVPGPLGDLLSFGISSGGDIAQGTADLVGSGTEAVADGAGFVAQKGSDFVGWLTGR